ncbi:hypothetical protein Tco_0008172 [Tanacetum coccineum]
MSNTNNTMQTQTSNALHNAIMEACGKDRPPMLTPSNYVQLNSRIKRYINTKPNNELIHYCLQNPLYKFKLTEKTVPVAERIDNDIYSTVDACHNACEMWKANERLKQGKSINVQDLETNLYWEFGKFTSRDGESLESYHSRFYKMMNELVRNQCDVTNHQVNVQFLLQLQPEWQRFVTLVKQSQELKTVSYHKLYDILKQHQNEVNEIRAEKLAQPALVADDDEMSKEKEIDKFLALISLSFKKIYKPTNNNLRTSSNTNRANQDNSIRINRGNGYDNQIAVNVVGARENVADWRDDTDDEPDDQELEAYYMYMAQIQEVTPDAVDNSGPIFDSEPLQEVQNDDDNYNVFDNNGEHPVQPESVNDTYLEEQGDNILTIDSMDMSTNGETVDQDDNDLGRERDLLASLIEKLKCEINDSKNISKFLESSNKTLVDKLKGEIEDLKNKNKSLESSNNHFKEANNELSKTNQLMSKDLKKFQDELEKRHDVNYMSKVELDWQKKKRDLMSYKTESQKSINNYSYQINDLNQKISDMKKELVAHQETISIMSQQKEDQMKDYKTREEKELEKVIALEKKIKVLDDIVYKTGQSVQTMNMLNHNCKTSFVKPEFLKKAQRANPRLYDIGCYSDNLALMLDPEYDEMIRLAQESRSKLSDLIRPFDYDKLNNLYDLFIPQREKSPEQRYFSERSKMSHTLAKNGNSKESFNKHTTLLERWMDESIPWDEKLDFLKSQMETQRIQLLNEIDRLSREYYYADHKNAILDFSKSKSVTKNNVSNDFSKLITAQILPQHVKSILKNTNVIALEAKQEELTCLTISVWELRDMLSKRKEIDFESNFYLLLGLEKLSDISLRMHANKSFIQYTSDVKTNISFTVLLKERSRMQPDTRWIVLDPFFPTKSTVSKKALYGFKNKLHRACLR